MNCKVELYLTHDAMLIALLVLLYLNLSCGANHEHLSERIYKLERRVIDDMDLLRREFYYELAVIQDSEHAGETEWLIENNALNGSVMEDKIIALLEIIKPTIGQLKKAFITEKRIVRSVQEDVLNFKEGFRNINGGFKNMLSALTRHINELNDAVKSRERDSQTDVLTLLKDIDKKITADKRYSDCSELLRDGQVTSGIYTIHPETAWRPLRVYCDMKTSGGGWTVFQRRQDGSENFERLWLDYAFGFGNLEGEFWLGNEFIHRLTSRGPHELRIELEDFDNDARIAEYGLFSVGPSSDFFKLSVEFFTGNVTDNFIPSHNGHQFSTKDKGPSTACSNSYKGGFWYSNCHGVNINGLYLKGEHKSYANGVNWAGWRGYHYSLKKTEMKFRPR